MNRNSSEPDLFTPAPPARDAVEIPDGFVEVSGAEFYRLVGPDARDVMPSVERPDVTQWRCQRGGMELVGLSWPGWRFADSGRPEAYAVKRGAFAGARGATV